MTSSQFSIFAVLYHKPGITMNELSELLVMDRTSLVRAIKPLSRDGYVEDAPRIEGSRQMALFLSKSGKEKYLSGFPHWQAAQKEYESIVGMERAAELRDALMGITRA